MLERRPKGKIGLSCLGIGAFLVILAATLAGCGTPTLTLVTPKATADSGMLRTVIPAFEKQNDVNVRIVTTANSMAAIKKGEAGSADVLLVCAPTAEEQFVKSGKGINRSEVMYSDYLIVGPANDPAGVKGFECPAKSSKKIAATGAPYVSRGDGSDVNMMEMNYWQKNGVGDPTGQAWYSKTGKGMVQTLQAASAKQAYVLTDMQTYQAVKDKLALVPLVQGCAMLMNRYGVMVVNPARHPDKDMSTTAKAKALVSFMAGKQGQQLIGSYKKYDMVLFHPCATTNAQPMKM